MKKSLLVLLVIGQLTWAQDAKHLSEYHTFQNGETVYMFGNDVKLRDQPNLESGVLSLLKIGEPIQILESTEATMELDGIVSPWYRVKTNSGNGYVLGSLISLDRAAQGSFTYLVSLKKEGIHLFLKTRVLESGENYKELVTPLLTEVFSIEATGNRGLETIESIFHINYLSESCGVNGGGIYFFHDGKTLQKAIDYSKIADGGLYWWVEEYIFPNEEGGVKGKIVYTSESGETKDDLTEWTETTITRRILEWNGTEVFPKVNTEEN